MTPRERSRIDPTLLAAFDRIEIRNPPFPMYMSIEPGSFHDSGRLIIRARVPDRDGGHPIDVMHPFPIPDPRYRAMMPFEEFVWDCIRNVVMHEAAECFHVDGVRVRDPHRQPKGVMLL